MIFCIVKSSGTEICWYAEATRKTSQPSEFSLWLICCIKAKKIHVVDCLSLPYHLSLLKASPIPRPDIYLKCCLSLFVSAMDMHKTQ